MKRPNALLRTWLAVVLTLTVALLPHHHHGEAVCTALEACDLDGLVNDRHTGHSTGRDCDESDCHVQTMRTFVATSVRQTDAPGPWLLPAALLPVEAWAPAPQAMLCEMRAGPAVAPMSACRAGHYFRRGPPAA